VTTHPAAFGYLKVPGLPATRFEVIEGTDGPGPTGYLVLLDHATRTAWPHRTREGCRLRAELDPARTRIPAAAWSRALSTYRWYAGGDGA